MSFHQLIALTTSGLKRRMCRCSSACALWPSSGQTLSVHKGKQSRGLSLSPFGYYSALMLCKPPLRRKKMFKRCRMVICAFVLLFAVLGLTSTGSTEPVTPGKARTRVFLKFTLNDGRLIKVVAFVGSKIKIQIQERTFNLTPSISDSDNRVVELAIAGPSLERRGVDGEQLVRLKFENESSDDTPINSDLSVRLLRVERVVKSPKQANPDERPGRQA